MNAKYRGKIQATGHEGDGDWVFGDKIQNHGKTYILPDYVDEIQHECEDMYMVQGLILVETESVGREVGLEDVEGIDGYEADIVDFGSTRPKYIIEWSVCNAGFVLRGLDERKEVLGISNLLVGVLIGNATDHKHLLETEK